MEDTGLRKLLVKFFIRGTLLALLALVALGLSAALPALVSAGKPATHRPPIVGIAHIALKTDNLAGAREFYGRTLGFQEPFSVRVAKNSRSDLAGSPGDLIMTFFKVNDHQYIELTPDLTSPTEDRLSHIAFETTDIRALRDYLAANGIEVPATLKPGVAGNLSFAVKDPDGHTVEFVEYIEGSLHSRNFGKFLPDTRIAQHMIHVGVTVRDRAAADHFYKDILGFQSIWYGGMTDDRADWVDMRVPEGTDWLEYMLNVRDPSPRTLGVMHHFALGVPDIHAAYKEIMSRGYKAEEPKIGRDGKWQLNLYDPDYTRAELMEPKPVRKPCCSMIIGQ
jgi:catechol 2,3-dioxygenase-like lactoylglutathione lyase family enzyme